MDRVNHRCPRVAQSGEHDGESVNSTSCEIRGRRMPRPQGVGPMRPALAQKGENGLRDDAAQPPGLTAAEARSASSRAGGRATGWKEMAKSFLARENCRPVSNDGSGGPRRCCKRERPKESADHLDREAVAEVRYASPLGAEWACCARGGRVRWVAHAKFEFASMKRAEEFGEASGMDSLRHFTPEAHRL